MPAIEIRVFCKSLIFTVLVPGTVAIYVPYLMLRGKSAGSLAALRFAGLLPLALGAAIYIRCVWDFAIAGRGTPAPIDPPKTLVIRGLYCSVRNPMYVGVTLTLFGEATFYQSLRILRYAVAVWCLFHLFVLLYEEPTLRRKFGAEYEEYCKSVRRWIPRMRPIRGSPPPPAS